MIRYTYVYIYMYIVYVCVFCWIAQDDGRRAEGRGHDHRAGDQRRCSLDPTLFSPEITYSKPAQRHSMLNPNFPMCRFVCVNKNDVGGLVSLDGTLRKRGLWLCWIEEV